MRFMETTRTQIWGGFVLVMLIVLLPISYVAYTYVSQLLVANAQQYTDEIASQANGRLDALLNQIDTITLQATMEPQIQSILGRLSRGEHVPVKEQLELREPTVRLSSFLNVVHQLDVYSLDQSVYPADGRPLLERIPPQWVTEADRQSGRLVWIGLDPNASDSIVGIRQVRLESSDYRKGGYIIISASAALLDFLGGNIASIEGSAMFLLNAADEIVSYRNTENLRPSIELLAGDSDTIDVNGKPYKLIRQQANVADWTLVMLIPMSKITEGTTGLQRLYWMVGAVGAAVFAVIAFAVSTIVTKPLRRLAAVMRGNRDGRFRTNAAVYYNREINALNYSYNRMVANMNQLIDEVYKQEIVNMRSELHTLHAQIHPHFLYNTLEAFYWSLVQKGEDELASKVISLSRLFRYVIRQEKNAGGNMVPLQDEMEHVGSYLELMSMRMGDRLAWRVDFDPELRRMLIPKLTVQPLVENAILHGVEPKIGSGVVTVGACRDPETGDAVISVSDTGEGMSAEDVFVMNGKLRSGEQVEGRRTGIGLHNISKRVHLHYGKAYGLEIASARGEGTTVLLRLPAEAPDRDKERT